MSVQLDTNTLLAFAKTARQKVIDGDSYKRDWEMTREEWGIKNPEQKDYDATIGKAKRAFADLEKWQKDSNKEHGSLQENLTLQKAHLAPDKITLVATLEEAERILRVVCKNMKVRFPKVGVALQSLIDFQSNIVTSTFNYLFGRTPDVSSSQPALPAPDASSASESTQTGETCEDEESDGEKDSPPLSLFYASVATDRSDGKEGEDSSTALLPEHDLTSSFLSASEDLSNRLPETEKREEQGFLPVAPNSSSRLQQKSAPSETEISNRFDALAIADKERRRSEGDGTSKSARRRRNKAAAKAKLS